MIPTEPIYLYGAVVKRVYDGDTIYVDWDMGDGLWQFDEPIRLLGVKAPEVRGIEKWFGGFKSRDYLNSIIGGKQIIMRTVRLPNGNFYKIHDKKGKYGRILGTIYFDGKDINKHMIDEGYAKVYE